MSHIIEKSYQLHYPWLDSTDTTPSACFLCRDNSPHSAAASATVFHFSVNNTPFTIKHCELHDLLYIDPMPGHTFLNQLYNHPTYFLGTDDMYGVAVDEEKSKKIAQVRIEEIRRYAPQASSFLEVGCGHGHTLLEAQRRDFTRVLGIEYSSEGYESSLAKNVPVILGTANNALHESLQESFDVIASYSVLEHLENPLKTIVQLRQLLHPTGIGVFRVPRMSRNGPWLSLVDHVWHFTEKSFAQALKQAGFMLIDLFPSGTFQGIQHPGELQSMTAIVRIS